MTKGRCFVCSETTHHKTFPHDGDKVVYCCSDECYNSDEFQSHAEKHEIGGPKPGTGLKQKIDKRTFFGSVHDWFKIEVTEATASEVDKKTYAFKKLMNKEASPELTSQALSRTWLICFVLNKLVQRVEILCPDWNGEGTFPLTTKPSSNKVCTVQTSAEDRRQLLMVLKYDPNLMPILDYVSAKKNRMGWKQFNFAEYFSCMCFRDRYDWTSTTGSTLNLVSNIFSVEIDKVIKDLVAYYKKNPNAPNLYEVSYTSTESYKNWTKQNPQTRSSIDFLQPTVLTNGIADISVLRQLADDASGKAWVASQVRTSVIPYEKPNKPGQTYLDHKQLRTKPVDNPPHWQLKTKLQLAKDSLLRSVLEPWNAIPSPYAEEYPRLKSFMTMDYVFKQIALIIPEGESQRGAQRIQVGGNIVPISEVILIPIGNLSLLSATIQPIESGWNNFADIFAKLRAADISSYLYLSRISSAKPLFPIGSKLLNLVVKKLESLIEFLKALKKDDFKDPVNPASDKTILGTAMNDLMTVKLVFTEQTTKPEIIVSPAPTFAIQALPFFHISDEKGQRIYPKLSALAKKALQENEARRKSQKETPLVVPPVVAPPVVVPAVVEPKKKESKRPNVDPYKPVVDITEGEIRVPEDAADYRSDYAVSYRKQLSRDIELLGSKAWLKKWGKFPLSAAYFLMDSLFEIAILCTEPNSSPVYRVFPVNSLVFPLSSADIIQEPLSIAVRYHGQEYSFRQKLWSVYRRLRLSAKAAILDDINSTAEELRRRYWESRFTISDQNFTWDMIGPDGDNAAAVLDKIIDVLNSTSSAPPVETFTEYYNYDEQKQNWVVKRNLDYPVYIGSQLIEGDKRSASELDAPESAPVRTKVDVDSQIEDYAENFARFEAEFSLLTQQSSPVDWIKARGSSIAATCYLFDRVIKNIGILVSEEGRQFYKVIPVNASPGVWDDSVKLAPTPKIFLEFAGSETEMRRKYWSILAAGKNTLPLLREKDDPDLLWAYWLYRFNIPAHDLLWQPLCSRELSRSLFSTVLEALRRFLFHSPPQTMSRYYKFVDGKWRESTKDVVHPKYIGGKHVPAGMKKILGKEEIRKLSKLDVTQIVAALKSGKLQLPENNIHLTQTMLFWKHYNPLVALAICTVLCFTKITYYTQSTKLRLRIRTKTLKHFLAIDDSAWNHFGTIIVNANSTGTGKLLEVGVDIAPQLACLQQALRLGVFNHIFGTTSVIAVIVELTKNSVLYRIDEHPKVMSANLFARVLDEFSERKPEALPTFLYRKELVKTAKLSTIRLHRSYGIVQGEYKKLKPFKLNRKPTLIVDIGTTEDILFKIFPLVETHGPVNKGLITIQQTTQFETTSITRSASTAYDGFVKQIKFHLASGLDAAYLELVLFGIEVGKYNLEYVKSWFATVSPPMQEFTATAVQQLLNFLAKYVANSRGMSKIVLLYNEEVECWSIVHPKSTMLTLW